METRVEFISFMFYEANGKFTPVVVSYICSQSCTQTADTSVAANVATPRPFA